MRTDRERRPIVMKVTPRGLEPVGAQDADALSVYQVGHWVNVTVKQRRSNEQQGMYWAGLQRAVEATEAYPTADHLHEAVKLALGYTTPIRALDGTVMFVPDSTAFGKMDRGQFTEFFDRARKLVIERFGFDPWEQEQQSAA